MHKIVKLKLTLTLFLTLTDTGGVVLTLLLGYRSSIHLSEHRKRVYIELLANVIPLEIEQC